MQLPETADYVALFVSPARAKRADRRPSLEMSRAETLKGRLQRVQELFGAAAADAIVLESLSTILIHRKRLAEIPSDVLSQVDVIFDHDMPVARHVKPGTEVSDSNRPVATTDCGDVLVGLVDTGIVAHDEFLPGRLRQQNFANPAAGQNELGDLNGHGTFVGGLIAGRRVGMAPGAALAVAAAFPDGTARFCAFVQGLHWLSTTRFRGPDHPVGVDVINVSAGTPRPDPRYYRFFFELRLLGIPCVAAIGNDSTPEDTDSPADYGLVVGVGSTRSDCLGIEEFFSETDFGTRSSGRLKPDLCAPGVDVTSAFASGGYSRQTGTSFAAATVTGACARLLHHFPQLRGRPGHLEAKLEEFCAPLLGGTDRSRLGRLNHQAIQNL